MLYRNAIGALVLIFPTLATAAVVLPTPLDGEHVIPLGPADFRSLQGAPLKPLEDRAGVFDQTALGLQDPLRAEFKVRQAGKYTLWVRISQPTIRPYPVKVRLSDSKRTLLEGVVNDGDGDLARGGPAAHAAYLAQAKTNTPSGAVPSLDEKKFTIATEKKPAAAVDDIAGELIGELREKPSDPWVSLTRVEEFPDDITFYWWKLGPVELKPGTHRLHVEPEAKSSKVVTFPRFDAALLTTASKLAYPFARDIGWSKATFVRFRLDGKPPADGVRIAAAIQTHVLQFPIVTTVFGPKGFTKDELHSKSGFTPWYRLQDINHFPVASQHEVGLRLSVTQGTRYNAPPLEIAGTTQFASYPHPDFIAREFDWREPTGLNYAVPTDVETYTHRLMTFRDQAREHYETAAKYTERLNPLTRGELYFTGICGSLNADDRDYLHKTIRLLGFNSVTEIGDPMPARRRYGWDGAEFVANLPLDFPFDEAKARAEYDAYFRDFFADPAKRERWLGAKSFCISDEPGEAFRADMTAPVWQYLTGVEPSWHDPVGSSEIYSRPNDLKECVVEGVAEHDGTGLEFRVAVDDPRQPTHYWYWRLDYPQGPAINSNLSFGEIRAGETPRPSYRMVQSMSNTRGKLKFKIVHQNTTATLFINGQTIHQHLNLPQRARFGIAGGKKHVYQVRLRPLVAGEGVGFQEGTIGADAKKDDKPEAAALEEFGLSGAPAWAKPKPLRQAVEEDWIQAGGNPVVKQVFRDWARQQGLTPSEFGAKDWQDVHPLTMASLVQTEHDARRLYWSRKFSGWFTPHRFTMIGDAVVKHAPNPKMWNYAALSGGSIYRAKEMPLDMFELASHGNNHTGGISDWMFYSTWRWDSHQTVAYSAELYNAGARRHGQRPSSFPMMHCVAPTIFRAYTQIANQVRVLSCYSYGPYYLNVPDAWSRVPGPYEATSLIANRAALCDDILAGGLTRPSRVALLYAHSTEYWDSPSSFDDRRSTFLGLSHEYFQPEIVTEEQVLAGALQHYDALYVLDPYVAADVQDTIGRWVTGGGLLWSCADALTRDQFNRPTDLLAKLAGLNREFLAQDKETKPAGVVLPKDKLIGPMVKPVAGAAKFRAHTTVTQGTVVKLTCDGAKVLAAYEGGGPAWIEKPVGKGRLVYVGHRAGSTYSARLVTAGGYKDVWSDTGRELLTGPLHVAGVARPLVLSEPTIMATATDSEAGSVVILYNMRPNPRKNLTVRLREPKAPHSVETFEGLKLRPAPFEYRDGWVEVPLADFDEGQIVVVRRGPKPADDRVAKMRERTIAQLAVSDPEDLSAGAWFAGYYPEWNLGEQVAALLEHPTWNVRRAAAEAIGRMKFHSAGERLYVVSQNEKDAHVLADQLLALAAIQHPCLAERCLAALSHPNYLVRVAAMRGLGESSANRDLMLPAVQTALEDNDARVRREAIELLGRFDAQDLVERTLKAYQSDLATTKLDGPALAEALAHSDDAFAAYLAAKPESNDALLLAVARHRCDPKLATALVAAAPRVHKDLVSDWIAGMLKQRSPEAARQLFAQRDKLSSETRHYLTLVLEHAFEAEVGESLADWEEFLVK